MSLGFFFMGHPVLMRRPSLGGARIAKETCVLSRRPATFYEGIWCHASGKSRISPVVEN